MNVPKLRFKEFTEEWKCKSLINISNNICYGMNSASKDYDGENAYIRITDIDENTGKYIKNNLVSPDGILESKYLVKEHDILFARTGASTGKTYLYCKDDGKLYYAGFLIKANIKKEFNSDFIYQQTKSNNYKKWVKIMSMRSGQPGINSEEYGSYKFSITAIDEQIKIGNLLSLLDKKIELQSKKIEALKLYKEGLDNEIFKNCTNEYNVKDIINEYNKKTTINNQYKILSSTASGIFLQSEYFNKQTASQDNSGYKIVPNGYITYRSMSDTGKFYFNIQNIIDKGIVSPAYPVFSVNEELVNKNYFVYFINNNKKFKQSILSTKEGGTRFALSITKFKDIKLCLPTLVEQKRYANIINNYNNKLYFENQKLSKLLELKKGLIQNLFV